MIEIRRQASADRAVTASIRALHLASLGVAFLVLLWLNRHHWFVTDEWAALVGRRLVGGDTAKGVWSPHNEHWSTVPILVYRLLFTLFGVRTYLPYVIVLVATHLMVAHLLWRVMLRIRVDALLATALCGVFALLGSGSDNLLLAWQWGLIAPLAFGLGALLITPERGGFQRGDLITWLLLVLGLMCSGLAITMTAVVGAVVLLRRGWKLALAAVGLPAVTYLIWYGAYGRTAPDTGEPIQTALRKSPAYVWRGLTGAIDSATGLTGIAAVVIAGLALWVLTRSSARVEPWPVPLSMAGGAALFLFLTGLRRSGLTIDQAATSRYVYVVIALLLPLAAMALGAALSRTPWRVGLIAVLAAYLLLVQVPLLRDGAASWAEIEQPQKRRVVAAAELLRAGDRMLAGAPVPVYIPDLTNDDIVRLDREGDLPGNIEVTPTDRLNARVFLQLAVGAAPALPPSVVPPGVVSVSDATTTAGTSADCLTLTPTTDAPSVVVSFPRPSAFSLTTGQTAPVDVSLRDAPAAGAESQPRSYPFAHGIPQWLSVSHEKLYVRLALPADSPTTLCGVRDRRASGAKETIG